MKPELTTLAIAILMASVALTSCSLAMGRGDVRDRNIERATLTRLDSLSGVEYVGMSDVYEIDNDRCRVVIIYNVTDSAGNPIEHNARVTTNFDCSEILTWEELESTILTDTKKMVCGKMKEKGIDFDGSLIDAIIKLKKLTR